MGIAPKVIYQRLTLNLWQNNYAVKLKLEDICKGEAENSTVKHTQV